METAVWWIRRDLRLSDNQALQAARETADAVVPLFIVDPFFETSPFVSERRRAFLWDGLRQLEADLHQVGSRLIVRYGRPQGVIAEIQAESGAGAVFAEEDFSRYARERDSQIEASHPLHLVEGLVVHPPETLLKQDGSPYTVFTPFKKNAWLRRPLPQVSSLLAAPESLETPAYLTSDPLPEAPGTAAEAIFPAGEAEAKRRLAAFVAAGINQYREDRNRVDLEGTSKVSPYLRFGMISARQAAVSAVAAIQEAKTKAARAGAETWLSELIWREFYLNILYHFPHVLQGSFRPEYDQIAWRNDLEAFEAWQNGRTGYPLVDAAMRQLNETGWMHNRARMVVASFLVKDLLIDWRWGEKYFMQLLVDGDPANNNGGWQWTAGTGTDAAPYFRIFNPTSQAKKFDPEGSYIRRWLPELSGVPAKYIHEPWTMPPEAQKSAGCIIGQDYPMPIVDHRAARERTLAAYKDAREAAA